MKHITILFIAIIASIFTHFISAQRLVINLNSNWKFSLHDNPASAGELFNDNQWKEVDIPHDWSYEKGISKNGTQSANGGYFDGGIGWYRKDLDISKDWLTKTVSIAFDGIYMNSEVWINGHYLGKRPYGYISFRYTITQYLKAGKNTIAIRVDNSQEPSARWYHPCGIYAPVHLVITHNQAISPNGVYITTPLVSKQKATIKLNTTLENLNSSKQKATLETSILDATGKKIASKTLPVKWDANHQAQIPMEWTVENPQLWSPSSPTIYKAVSRLFIKNKIVDKIETSFGIRSIEWKTESGFWLNGKVTKLLGVSEHFEAGPVGGAWTKPLLRWKLSLLKQMGVNAIRTAHNPAPPMFYDLCDELGIMVMDEIFDGWGKKAPQDYGFQAFNEWWKPDMTEWLTRNRNHPSIVIYSVGNETKGTIAQQLVDLCHLLDPTRPVTSGHSSSEYMDVFGVNGGSEKTGFFDKPRPNKPFVSTEAPHTWQTRGYYRTKTWLRDGNNQKKTQHFDLPDLTAEEIFYYEWADPDQWVNGKQHFNSSYDNATVRISARKNWEIMRDLDWFSGHFRWTGFDYYGEAGYVHGGWPFRLFMGGALDVAGFKKDLFYFYQSQWTTKPMVHILPHWTHPTMEQGTLIPVWVYSNCDEVELFINGRSLGKDKPGKQWDEMQCQWMVPWEPGTILAKGYKSGKEVESTQYTTAYHPATISLTKDSLFTNTMEDNVAIITTAINDSSGVFYPYGENTIYYHLNGHAHILSLENGDPVDTTHNVGINFRKAFMGLNNAFIKIGDDAQDVSLTAAAILGEKQLITSKQVSIDVTTIALKGNSPSSDLQIFYTLNGEDPATAGTLYTQPFPIELGTTVKAVVKQNGVVILSMKETFDKGLGLCWKKTTAETSNKKIMHGMRAVDADFSGAVVEVTNHIKYLDFHGKEGKIIWYQENDGSAGPFHLIFNYASKDNQSSRPMDLYINGKKVSTLNFNAGDSWNSQWKQVSTTQNLIAGANYIELRTTGQSGPNIYLLQVD